MKYALLFFFGFIVTHAQIKKEHFDLMPWPQKIESSEAVFYVNKNFKINVTGNPDSRVFIGATRFLRRLDERSGLFFNQGFVTKINEFPEAQLQINCDRIGKIGLQEDESYRLAVKTDKIVINAVTDLGALYALETLSQLLQNDGVSFYFPAVEIEDAPRFPWRGLMIDAARHFQPVDVIKRNLDGMAAMKMNVFHWHLSDNQGWRVAIKKYPKLIEISSDGDYYTQEQIKDVIKYADDRGIMVVPEIDVPGHASALIAAFPEIGSKTDTENPYAVSRRSGIHDAALDPTNPKTYQILDAIFSEVCPLFPGDYFHIGGDENNGKEWNSNPKIQEFKKKNKLVTNHDLQTYFIMKLVPMLKKHGKQLMGWEEIITKEMSKDAIIHAWRGVNEGMEAAGALYKASKSGFKTVLSNGYYIDLMLSVDSHYLTDPMPKNVLFTDEEKARILGGEATMWSELVTPLNIDSRIWPRTAAIAERFWSSDTVSDLKNLHRRLKQISFRLEEIGLTHIRNKGVILRNISNYQDTKALEDFVNICEPYKVYKRNGGGKKYFMYSPLTLFADACTADASDAFEFNAVVNDYFNDKSTENSKLISDYFNKWISMNFDLIQLSKNAPLILPVLPLAKNLSEVSKELLRGLEQKQNLDKTLLNNLFEQMNSRNSADVELAVYDSLRKLADILK